MRAARPALAAGAWGAGTSGGAVIAAATGGEHGELLLQLHGTALGALGALPVGRANEDFAIAIAGLAMKLINRHGVSLTLG